MNEFKRELNIVAKKWIEIVKVRKGIEFNPLSLKTNKHLKMLGQIRNTSTKFVANGTEDMGLSF